VTVMRRIVRRAPVEPAGDWPDHVPMLLRRLYAMRGAVAWDDAQPKLARLHSPDAMGGMDAATALLADAIACDAHIVVVGDFDCDGATACAVGVRGLRLLGAKRVSHAVPNRAVHGYGLSPGLVDDLAALQPDLLVTVDHGIACHAGVAAARAKGWKVLVTDHHLPGETLPDAHAIVDPNLRGDGFPSKALAGVGVMFYVMLALRAELRNRKAFENQKEPNLAALTDLVALGTIADVVPLDANNRNLVAQGLKRLRAGRGAPGITALLRAAGRPLAEASSFDLGFVAGPRLNAAGRLADMSLGIECLITDDEARAANCAQELDRLNRERRNIEAAMLQQALEAVERIAAEERCSFFHADWHQGVVGIVASRLKDRLHRPVICFARAEESGAPVLRGSGRSIQGLHLRDALDVVSKRAPGLIRRFGGHAMAAGLSIGAGDYERFAGEFETVVEELLPPSARLRVVETDGALDSMHYSLEVARLLEAGIWGQGFPQPLFCDNFAVENQRVVGERHLKLWLVKNGRRLEAMRFGALDPLPSQVRAAYRLSVNEFNGLKNIQLNVEHFE